MKLTSLSKAVRTIGLMTALSLLVSTTVQQMANAQAQNGIATESETACVPLPEGGFFFDFQGIELTPEQLAAFRRFSAELSERATAMDVQTVPLPGGGSSLSMKGEVSQEMEKELMAAFDAITLDQVPDSEQVDEFNERYGQYAEFALATRLVFTPEQIAENDEINRAFEAQMLSIFTPEQQQIYRANLAIKRGIEACDSDRTDG
jgi:Spy/CpxP family protein refolding chaperone